MELFQQGSWYTIADGLENQSFFWHKGVLTKSCCKQNGYKLRQRYVPVMGGLSQQIMDENYFGDLQADLNAVSFSRASGRKAKDPALAYKAMFEKATKN